MFGGNSDRDFPDLEKIGYEITSPETRKYNCIAWAAESTTRKWWPDPLKLGFWPPKVPREETLEAFMQAFGTLGYHPCADGTQEDGFQKIALFAKKESPDQSESRLVPTHAASPDISPVERKRQASLVVVTGGSFARALERFFRAAGKAPPYPRCFSGAGDSTLGGQLGARFSAARRNRS